MQGGGMTRRIVRAKAPDREDHYVLWSFFRSDKHCFGQKMRERHMIIKACENRVPYVCSRFESTTESEMREGKQREGRLVRLLGGELQVRRVLVVGEF